MASQSSEKLDPQYFQPNRLTGLVVVAGVVDTTVQAFCTCASSEKNDPQVMLPALLQPPAKTLPSSIQMSSSTGGNAEHWEQKLHRSVESSQFIIIIIIITINSWFIRLKMKLQCWGVAVYFQVCYSISIKTWLILLSNWTMNKDKLGGDNSQRDTVKDWQGKATPPVHAVHLELVGFPADFKVLRQSYIQGSFYESITVALDWAKQQIDTHLFIIDRQQPS